MWNRLSNFGKALGDRIRKHYGWVLAVIGALLGAAGLYVALNPDEPWTPEQLELREAIPPKVGTHCHRVEISSSPEHDFVRLVRARLECAPVDPGPEMVTFSLFTTEADQREYMHDLGAEWESEGFSCLKDYLSHETWVDANGTTRGELLCADGGSKAVVAWSDNTNLVTGFASSKLADESELHRWWQRSVKYEGDGLPREARDHLLDLLPDSFGACEPHGEGVPNSIVTVTCEPGGGITAAGAALFADRSKLEAHIDALAEIFTGKTEKGCDNSTFSYTTYGPGADGKPTQGMLLCYVSGGLQWFVWTANNPRVYAYAAREDESWSKLYDSWSNSLADIEGVQ